MKKEHFVVVHCWLPMDAGKIYTNSGGAAISNGLGKNQAHVGHVAISVHNVEGNNHIYEYYSFWPTVDSPGVSAVPGLFVDFEIDLSAKGENRKPDAQIIFYSLNAVAIKNHIDLLKQKLSQNNFKWCVSCKLADNSNNDVVQNCSSLSWNLLLTGGFKSICDVSSSRSGAKSAALRKKYKCDEGSILDGFFDDAFWRDWFVSPKYVLHLASAAKERELKTYPVTATHDVDVEKWVNDVTTKAVSSSAGKAAKFQLQNGFEIAEVSASSQASKAEQIAPVNKYALENLNAQGDLNYLTQPQINDFGSASLAETNLPQPVICISELPNLRLFTADYTGTIKIWDLSKRQEDSCYTILNLGTVQLNYGELFQNRYFVYGSESSKFKFLSTRIFDLDTKQDVIVCADNLYRLYKLNETQALMVFVEQRTKLYLYDLLTRTLTLLSPQLQAAFSHKILVFVNNEFAIVRDACIEIYAIENKAMVLKSKISLSMAPTGSYYPQFRYVQAFCELPNGNIFIAGNGGHTNYYDPSVINSVAQIYDRKTGQCIHTMSTAISLIRSLI